MKSLLINTAGQVSIFEHTNPESIKLKEMQKAVDGRIELVKLGSLAYLNTGLLMVTSDDDVVPVKHTTHIMVVNEEFLDGCYEHNEIASLMAGQYIGGNVIIAVDNLIK